MNEINIIIRDRVVYEPRSHSLFYADDAMSQASLGIPASLCLLYLLEHQGQLVPGQALLDAVWKSRGMNVSPNTLYQNLSLLRKALNDFGLGDGLIKTVPKRGFLVAADEDVAFFCPLSPHIPARRLASSSPEVVGCEEPASIGPRSPSMHEANAEVSAPGARPARRRSARVALAALVLAVAAGGIWWHFTGRFVSPAPRAAPTSTTFPGGCSVTYFSPVSLQEKEGQDRQVSEIMRENRLDCTPDRRMYFSAYTSFSPENYGRTLLAYCSLGDKGEVVACNNFYYLDWRTY